MYNEFVRKFKTKFKTNVHIIIYKDFINNTNQELSRLFSFLGIKDVKIDFNKQYMAGGWKWKNDLFRKIFMKRHFLKKFIPFKRLIKAAFKSFATDSVEKIDDTIREKLIGIYKDDIKNLSTFLNKDLNFWTK